MKSIWDTRFSTSKARTFSEALERSGFALDGWVTMNGSRVLIGEAGEILGGLGGEHNGENVKDLKKPDNSTQEKPAQSTTTAEKPVLSSDRAEAEKQINAYVDALYAQGMANGTWGNVDELRKAGKDREAAEAIRQCLDDIEATKYEMNKEFMRQNISSCEPGKLSAPLSKEQEIYQAGYLDTEGACASRMMAYVAIDRLGLDVQDRGNRLGAIQGPGNERDAAAVRTIASLSNGLIKAAGGDVKSLTERENRPIEAAVSFLQMMESGKEYVFSAASFGGIGHTAIARKTEEAGQISYQFLELQKWPTNAITEQLVPPKERNGWKALNVDSLGHRFGLVQNTNAPVQLSLIETGKLANSQEFQGILPYANGKPKTKREE